MTPTAPDPLPDPGAASHGAGRRAARRRRAGTFRVLGVVLILVGVGMLGYVGWEMWGTNLISQRHHRALVDEVRQQWAAESGRTIAPVPTGGTSALIRIPRFGDDYIVPVLEGTDTDVLSRGYGHFSDSAGPGEIGNYALAGHRVTHGEPLRRMPELVPGDEVIVETREATYTYVLDTDPNALVIPFTGVWVLDALPKNPEEGGPEPEQRPGQRLITLTSCAEIFHTADRMIAFGHLDSVVKKTP